MYVDPFWAGVFVTVFAEISLIFILAVFFTGGKK